MQVCCSVLFFFAKVFQNTEVFKGGNISFDFVAGCQLAEQAAHDFATSGFRQSLCPPDFIGLGDGADLLGYMFAQCFTELHVAFVLVLEGDECHKGVALDVIGTADHCGFRHSFIGDESAFDFARAESVA